MSSFGCRITYPFDSTQKIHFRRRLTVEQVYLHSRSDQLRGRDGDLLATIVAFHSIRRSLCR